jgi:cardiolipin synthase
MNLYLILNKEKCELKNIPNLLTLIRFLLIPVMLYYLFTDNLKIALTIYVLASATDVVDGYVARKFDMITDLGKILDPLADKLLQFAALIGLWYSKIIPLWILIVFFCKEIIMGVGCFKLMLKDNVIVQAKWFGKLSTCTFFLAIIVSMLSRYFTVLAPYPVILMVIALAMAVFALIMYLRNYLKVIKKVEIVE